MHFSPFCCFSAQQAADPPRGSSPEFIGASQLHQSLTPTQLSKLKRWWTSFKICKQLHKSALCQVRPQSQLKQSPYTIYRHISNFKELYWTINRIVYIFRSPILSLLGHWLCGGICLDSSLNKLCVSTPAFIHNINFFLNFVHINKARKL